MSIDRIVTPALRRRASACWNAAAIAGSTSGMRIRRGEREVLSPAGRLADRVPEREHVGRRVREEPERVEALREREHALQSAADRRSS